MSYKMTYNFDIRLCLGGLELFRGFLRSEFSEENLEFWIECQEFKALHDNTMLLSHSQKIFDDYVALQAPKEVIYIVYVLVKKSPPFSNAINIS